MLIPTRPAAGRRGFLATFGLVLIAATLPRPARTLPTLLLVEDFVAGFRYHQVTDLMPRLRCGDLLQLIWETLRARAAGSHAGSGFH